MKKVSIIIPAFNAERFINRSIGSALKQTYKNIEIIVIDDGSTDATYAIAQGYEAEFEFIKLIHTANGGVCQARNIGLDNITGEYVTFLDADDTLIDSAVEKMVTVMEKTDADMAEFFGSRGSNSGKISIWTGTTALQKSIEDNPRTYSACRKMYKAKFLSDVRFTVGRRVHEDSFFVFECLCKCPRMAICNFPVYNTYFTPNSAAREAFSDKFLDILYFAARKREIIEKCFPEFAEKAKNITVKANMCLLGKLFNSYNLSKEQKGYISACIKEVIKYKKNFIPSIKRDKKMFFIICHHLYKPARLVKMIRKRCLNGSNSFKKGGCKKI